MNKTKSKFSVKKLMVGLAAGVLALLLAAFGAVWMIWGPERALWAPSAKFWTGTTPIWMERYTR